MLWVGVDQLLTVLKQICSAIGIAVVLARVSHYFERSK